MVHHANTVQAIALLRGNPLFMNAICRTLEGQKLNDHEREFYIRNLEKLSEDMRIRKTVEFLKTNVNGDQDDRRKYNFRFVIVCLFLGILTMGYVLTVAIVNDVNG